MEIDHKSIALKWLTQDAFALIYAKRTQFRVALSRNIERLARAEAGTQASSAKPGSGSRDWRGIGQTIQEIMPERTQIPFAT
jgi:hypothetical protein